MEAAENWDVVVIGAGMGACALASELAEDGIRVVLLERGGFVKPEAANWDAAEVIGAGRYESDEMWIDEKDKPFHPRIYHCVGGNSKFFGATAFRYRESDFLERILPDGSRTAPWPISYEDLKPWYEQAEAAMRVHGQVGSDPGEAPRSSYPHPPIEHEPAIADLARRLQKRGLKPFPLPVAVDQSRCRKGSPCDGFPCRIRAKGDGENAFLRPALKASNQLKIHTGIRIEHLVHDESGSTIIAAEGQGPQGRIRYHGRIFVLAAGAAGSPLLLLNSTSAKHPNGLSNQSGMVGRNVMAHNNSVMMAFSPFRKNPTRFQKTLAIHDFYTPGNTIAPKASGGIQMRGKIKPENLARHPSPFVRLLRNFIANRSLDFWVMSEDPALMENRLTIGKDGCVRLKRKTGNLQTHRNLVRKFRKILLRCAYPIVLTRPPRAEALQHICGTIRFGSDPATSVLDKDCRSREVSNLYVCDASVFPSSAAVNPALTVAANALRVGRLIRHRLKGKDT